MLPAELLKKVKLLEIQTRKLVNSLFAGEYHSAFKGQGMTFSDFREYVPGDDVRNISWTLTARAGKPFIKKYDEERELTLMIVVDVSGSGIFGSQDHLKIEVIAYLSALLSFSAIKNNDRVGLLLFSNQVEKFVPPKKGRAHVHRILRDILFFEPKNLQTNITSAMEHLRNVLKKKTHIFIFSDFMDSGFETALRFLSRRHSVAACVVEDPLEIEIPKIGMVEMGDPETGENVTVDTSSALFQKWFKQESQKRRDSRNAELRRAKVDRIDIRTDKNFADPLIAFFKRKHK